MPAKSRPSKMPKFKPAPEAVVTLFHAAITGLPDVESRKMFGYPCAFINGQMLTGVYEDRIMLRLSEQDRAQFLKLPGAKLFEPMPGRPMREYVELPSSIMSSPSQLKRWLKRGLAYVGTLPPKTKKGRKAKK
ncbi:MAG TPA: TfoX/Sxy family protein [Anaerolineae bacterium]|nr:TfoX/Sxy family protein [Anaerolineae bacterium]